MQQQLRTACHTRLQISAHPRFGELCRVRRHPHGRRNNVVPTPRLGRRHEPFVPEGDCGVKSAHLQAISGMVGVSRRHRCAVDADIQRVMQHTERTRCHALDSVMLPPM
jgi:hypothetical protein